MNGGEKQFREEQVKRAEKMAAHVSSEHFKKEVLEAAQAKVDSLCELPGPSGAGHRLIKRIGVYSFQQWSLEEQRRGTSNTDQLKALGAVLGLEGVAPFALSFPGCPPEMMAAAILSEIEGAICSVLTGKIKTEMVAVDENGMRECTTEGVLKERRDEFFKGGG